MSKEVFYLLGPKGDGCWSESSYSDVEVANIPWRCKHCRHLFDGTKQIDIKIDVTHKYLAKQRPYTFSVHFDIDIVYEPFIRTIPQQILDRDMFFGNVIGSDGKRVEDWLTCQCKYNLFRRGTKDIMTPAVCKYCGYLYYWAGGKWHLYPAPPEDADILQN